MGEFLTELTSEEAGGHGNRWEIFNENVDELIAKYLPIVVQGGKLLGQSKQGNLHGCMKTEPEGAILTWPNHEFGAMAIIGNNDDGHFLASAFPFFGGIPQGLIINNLRMWPGRLEAEIESRTPEDMELIFFDTSYLLNRLNYKPGETCSFQLAGLAYRIEYVKPEPIFITNPDTIKHMRSISAEDDAEKNSLDPIRVETTGMAALMLTKWTSEYEFRGPVKQVDELSSLLDNRLWRIVVTVARPEDREIDVPIYATERVLKGWIPKIGEDCQGVLWLQGHSVMQQK